MQITQSITQFRNRHFDSPVKKILGAAVLSAITLGVLGAGYIWSDPILRQRFFGTGQSTANVQTLPAANLADNRLDEFNPVTQLYKKRTVQDLPLYPNGWVKKYFTDAEQKNLSLAGEGGDADQDGLTNKQEFIYGSNPRQAQTLGNGKTDSVNVAAGISPLTGLKLEKQDYSFYFLQSDEAAIKSVSDASDTLYAEGLDLPQLYEQSRTYDFKPELDQIKIVVIENPNRNQALGYLEQRANLALDSSFQNFTLDLANIFLMTTTDQVDQTLKRVNGQIAAFQVMPVPKPEVDNHRANIFFIQQIQKILAMRREMVEGKNISKEESDRRNLDISKRLVWSYRIIVQSAAQR